MGKLGKTPRPHLQDPRWAGEAHAKLSLLFRVFWLLGRSPEIGNLTDARRSVEQHCHTRAVPGQRSRAPRPLWPILDRRHQKYYLRAREVPASSDVTKDLCAAAARSSSPGTLLHSMKTWDKRRR